MDMPPVNSTLDAFWTGMKDKVLKLYEATIFGFLYMQRT